MAETAYATEAPAAPPPSTRRGPVGAGVNAWRQLTSMRSALLLLLLLALAAVPGSLLPQRGLNASKVDLFLQAHPTLGPVLDRLSLFDVFGAPWFAAIYLALFVSLAGCVLPRLWRQAATLRARPPATPRHLRRLPVSAGWRTRLTPAEVIEEARTALRGWRVDVRQEPAGALTLAAERGFLKEAANLVFHVSLLLLLAGVALGGLFGYKGNVLVKEGDAFSNTMAFYDSLSPGRLFTSAQLAPFRFTLDDFSATYQPNGSPATFLAKVRFAARPGGALRPYQVRVNHPLQVGGAKVYLIGHGYAPRFVVRGPDGKVAFDAAVPFLPRDGSFASDGVVKVPDIAPAKDGTQRQLGFSGFFTPTTAVTPYGITSGFPAARDPSVTLLAWRGDLGLDSGRPQSVYSLQTARMRRFERGGQPVTKTLRPGETMTLPGGAGSITMTGYAEFATFQITHDPGRQLALAAAMLLVAGLVASLRIRRRRFWLRARPDGARTAVEAGGLARSDPESFAAEFTTVIARLEPPATPPSHAPED